jgi:hypothetical protein
MMVNSGNKSTAGNFSALPTQRPGRIKSFVIEISIKKRMEGVVAL